MPCTSLHRDQLKHPCRDCSCLFAFFLSLKQVQPSFETKEGKKQVGNQVQKNRLRTALDTTIQAPF